VFTEHYVFACIVAELAHPYESEEPVDTSNLREPCSRARGIIAQMGKVHEQLLRKTSMMGSEEGVPFHHWI
jgi:hypothetical protein